MFAKLERKKRSQHVIEQIVQAIQRGDYRVGDKLPPERIIAEETGVSRASVREALSILSVAGVIERRPGDGTYIRATHKEALSRALSFPEEVDLLEVFELQKILEPAVAELAMEKLGEDDLRRIEEALRRMEQGVEKGDREEYIAGDRAFHLAIAQATKNSLIERHVASLINLMNHKLWKEFKSYSIDFVKEKEYFLRSLKAHQLIFEALKEKDKERLRRTMREHFQRVEKKVFKGLEATEERCPRGWITVS